MATTLEKFKDGKSMGAHLRESRAARKSHENACKAKLRARDGPGCRWPGCEYWRRGVRVEGAHLEDKGMGGDKQSLRTQPEKMIRLCWEHHQGAASVHSTHLDVRPLTSRGTDGPCAFWFRPTIAAEWQMFGAEDEATFARKHKRQFEAHDDEDEA